MCTKLRRELRHSLLRENRRYNHLANTYLLNNLASICHKAYNHFEDAVSDDEDETVVAAESKEVQLLKEIRDGINKINK